MGDEQKYLAALVLALVDSSSESDSESDIDIGDLIKDESDEAEDLLLKELIKTDAKESIDYLEIVVPSYTEEEFRWNFRISRNLFEHLCDRFENSDIYKNLRADKRLSGEMNILVFLWFAGHEACSFRQLAKRFNISLHTVCSIIHRTAMFIGNLSTEIIKWPNEQQKEETSRFFRHKAGFSKVIGCIDVTHVPIDPPLKRKDDYIDRRGDTSLCLQAVCNEKKKFINIFVGYPGSAHNSKVLQNAPIYPKLSAVCGDYYLLGNFAYPCSEYLLTPYQDNENMTNSQKEFNVKLNSCQVTIEHCFRILKQRFRQLYYCKLRGDEKVCNFIKACCVLHNMADEDDIDFSAEPIPNDKTKPVHHNETSNENSLRDVIRLEMLRRRK